MHKDVNATNGCHAYSATGEGTRYRWQDAVITIKISPGDSPFTQFSVVEMELPGAGQADLFAYRATDRLYYCTEGRGSFTVGPREHAIEEGSFVYCGRAIPLALRNSGDKPLRVVACSIPPGPEARADLLPAGDDLSELRFSPHDRRLLGILSADEAAAVGEEQRGPCVVMAPDEGVSYWQAEPTAGYIAKKLGPDNASIHHCSAVTQLLEPGAYVREHGHVRHQEVLIAVKGRASISIDGKERDFSAGTVAAVGPYALHSFRNVGTTPFMAFGFATPAGIEAGLRETGLPRVAGEPRPPQIPRNAETGRLLVEKYGFIIPGNRG